MRAFLFIIICLLFWVIYQDLARSPLLQGLPNAEQRFATAQISTYTAIRMQAEPGDTLLSLAEKINGNRSIDIEKLIKDFKTLNPDAPDTVLTFGQYYEFPLYP